jgi:hypothetical protein
MTRSFIGLLSMSHMMADTHESRTSLSRGYRLVSS